MDIRAPLFFFLELERRYLLGTQTRLCFLKNFIGRSYFVDTGSKIKLPFFVFSRGFQAFSEMILQKGRL